MGKATRVPGAVGWGVDRAHLKAETRLITDDMRVPKYPIQKEHLAVLDNGRTA